MSHATTRRYPRRVVWPLPDHGLVRGTLPVADATGRLAVPFAPELRPRMIQNPAPPRPPAIRNPPSPTLAAIAARTGGREVSQADVATVLDPGPDRRSTLQPIRTQVLLVTLALFLIDVLLRRVSPSALIRSLAARLSPRPSGKV